MTRRALAWPPKPSKTLSPTRQPLLRQSASRLLGLPSLIDQATILPGNGARNGFLAVPIRAPKPVTLASTRQSSGVQVGEAGAAAPSTLTLALSAGSMPIAAAARPPKTIRAEITASL